MFSVLNLPFVVLSYLLVLIHHLFSFVIVRHLHYLLSELRVLVAFLPQLLKLMLQNSELFIVLDNNINICVARFPILYVLKQFPEKTPPPYRSTERARESVL